MKGVAFIIFFFSANLNLLQNSAIEYGDNIFDLLLTNSPELEHQFVELNEYTAYIDALQKLPEHIKEQIKYDATRSYNDVRVDFEQECSRIKSLYKSGLDEGMQFHLDFCTFEPSKNFPNIGEITCYYTVNIPGDEESAEDALRFECLKTESGWRILDGFFDATNP